MIQALTPQQVAERLQCSYQLVLSLIASGDLHAARLGRGYRITPSALDAFLASGGKRRAQIVAPVAASVSNFVIPSFSNKRRKAAAQ